MKSPRSLFRTLFLLLAFWCALVLSSKAQPFQMFVEMNPTPPALAYQWEQHPEILTVFIENNTTNPTEAILVGKLFDGNNNLVGETDFNSSMPFVLNPGPNMFMPIDMFQANMLIIDGAIKNSVAQTGLIPSDNYMLLVELINAQNPTQMLTEPQQAPFWIRDFEAPILMYPPDGEYIDDEALLNTLFEWTSVAFDPSWGISTMFYVFEIFEGQSAQEAVYVNAPLLEWPIWNGNTCWWPEDYISLDPCRPYAWTVALVDNSTPVPRMITSHSVPRTFTTYPRKDTIPSTSGPGAEPCPNPYIPTEHDKDACVGPTKTTEAGTAVSLGVMLENPDKYPYPRAVGLRAEAIDWDLVYFLCGGCEGSDSKKPYAVMDGVGKYKWKLIAGKGSLNAPIDLDELRKINERLAEIDSRMKEIDAEIKQIEEDTSTTIPNKIEELKARLRQTEKTLKSKDSILQIQNQKLDSLKTDLEKVTKKLGKVRNSMDSITTAINEHQEEIDSLQNILDGVPGAGEIAQRDKVKTIRDALELQKAQLALKEDEIFLRSEQLIAAITSAEQALADATEAYLTAQGQASALAQSITTLQTQMMSDPVIREYLARKREWGNLLSQTIVQYFPDSITVLTSEQMAIDDQGISAISVTDANLRASRYGVYQSMITAFSTSLPTYCVGLSPATHRANCQTAVNAVVAAAGQYDLALGAVVQTSKIFNRRNSRMIDSLQTILSAMEGNVRNAESAAEDASETYEDAIIAYTDEMERLEDEKKTMLEDIAVLEDSLAKEEDKYQNMVQARIDSLDKNRESYLNRQHVLNSWIASLSDRYTGLVDSVDKFLGDTLNLGSAIRVKNKEIKDLEKEINRLNSLISNIKDLIKAYEEKLKELAKKSKELKDEKEKLEKEKEELEEALKKLKATNRDATGPLVYYIPPPLEDVMKDKDKFEKLKEKVKEAEDSLKAAYEQKEKLQGEMVKIIERISKDLIKFKKAEDNLQKLEKDETELYNELQTLKTQKAQDHLDKQGKVQDKLDEEIKDRDSILIKIAKLKNDSTRLKTRLDELKSQIIELDSILAAKRRVLLDMTAQLDYEEKLLRNAKNTHTAKSSELNDEKEKLSELEGDLARAEDALSRATAKGNSAEITTARNTRNQVKTTVDLKKNTTIPALVTAVASTAQSIKSAELRVAAAIQSKATAFKEYQEANQNMDHKLMDSLLAVNKRYEKKLTALVHYRKKLKEAKRDIDQVNKDRLALQDTVASNINKDDEVKAAKKALEEVKEQIKDAKRQKKEAEEAINESVEKKKKKTKKARDDLEQAKENLKKAEKELRDFLVDEFKKVEFEVTLRLEAEDLVVDGFRAKDGMTFLEKKLKYKGDRVPIFEDQQAASNKPSGTTVNSICIPNYEFRKNGPAGDGVVFDDLEPRTIALLYKNGEPLWPEWPVIPADEPKLALDIVPTYAAFGPDKDVVIYSCATEADCQVPPPVTGGIRDLEKYTWTPDGTVISKHYLLDAMFWEPRKVPKPKPEEEQKLEVTINTDFIVGDDPKKTKALIPIKPGVMLEVTKELIGVPDTTMEVQARVVTGDHIGLDGEDIEFVLQRTAGWSKDYGFNGTDSLVKEPTKDGGYAKVDFNFGKGFAEFDITVRWKRGDEIIDEEEFEAKAPLHLKLHKFSKGPPTFAWNGGLSLFKDGKTVTESSLKSLTEGFPSSTEEETAGQYESVVHGIAGLINAERDYVNDELIEFKLSDKKLKLKPEKDSTKVIGIVRTEVEGEVPDESKISLTAKVDKKYEDIADPSTETKEYNSTKIEKFRIGADNDMFLVLLDEPATPGEEINGTGKLAIQTGGIADGLINALIDVKLNIKSVELKEEGEVPIAVAGSVSWVDKDAVKVNILGFEVSCDSFVVTASMGAGIRGKVNHTAIPHAVDFYAEMESTGDFIGRIDNFPALTIGGFKLKEGTSFTIDMHTGKSPSPKAGGFKGVFIHSAKLELPDIFKAKDATQPSQLEVKDLYVGSGGFGGIISFSGSLFNIGYAGYALEADSIGLEFENSSLKAGGFSGQLIFPSPMEGKVRATIRLSGEEWRADLSTENPVAIPRLGTTFTLLAGTGITYNVAEQVGTLRLNAHIESKDYDPITISGFEINSKGEIKADNIQINRDIKFGTGFKIHVASLSFVAMNNEYGLTLTGGLSFEKIGIDQLEGSVTVKPGPELTVTLTGGQISFERDPVTFNGGFSFTGREFKGNFSIGIKKLLPNGISGLLIVGNMEDQANVTFNYWYVELTVGVAIPLGQTGLSLLALGGGVGYNYNPPIGNQPGSPTHNDAFSFKAIVGIGNTPRGEVFNSRMEMVLVPGKFSLYGKIWVLDQEESIYGEGQLNLMWAPREQMDGYVRMFVGLGDAEGKVFSFDGKINFMYSSTQKYIKSEQIRGSFLQAVQAEAAIDITGDYTKMDGRVWYNLNKTYSLGIVSAIVVLNVEATGKFSYTNATSKLYAGMTFHGDWDVDLDTPLGVADILSGAVDLSLQLRAESTYVEMKGSASISYDVWVYSGSKSIDVGYRLNL